MATRTYYGLLALAGGGAVAATVGADVVGSERLAFGLAVGGFVLAWACLLAAHRVADHAGARDERYARIWYRSGDVGCFAMLATATVLASALDRRPDLLSTEYALLAVVAAGVVAMAAGEVYYKRAM